MAFNAIIFTVATYVVQLKVCSVAWRPPALGFGASQCLKIVWSSLLARLKRDDLLATHGALQCVVSWLHSALLVRYWFARRYCFCYVKNSYGLWLDKESRGCLCDNFSLRITRVILSPYALECLEFSRWVLPWWLPISGAMEFVGSTLCDTELGTSVWSYVSFDHGS